jgi:farnesyl-diphosphate farnesyltransferase
VLPGALRAPVGLAYLLARAADTIADTSAIPPERRLDHLLAFRAQVAGPASPDALGEISADLVASQASPAEADLLRALVPIFAELDSTGEADSTRIRSVVTTLTEGMELDLSGFSPEGSGELAALKNADALDRYTYLVAGCVGEFWTETLVAHTPSLSHWDARAMSETGVRFGKALQLTNVLRDIPADLRNGRCYLPLDELAALGLSPEDLLDAKASDRARPVLRNWIEIALDHYAEAQNYVLAIPRRERRLRLAALWPVLMGLQTLELLANQRDWLAPNQSAKVSRGWLYRMMARSTVIVSSDALVSRWITGLRGRVDAASRP